MVLGSVTTWLVGRMVSVGAGLSDRRWTSEESIRGC